jgi:CheY-like chemotaxis protein
LYPTGYLLISSGGALAYLLLYLFNKMQSMEKIIIADRNKNICTLLRRELELEGYQVTIACSGKDLLKEINTKESPDLLIMDIDLPCDEGLKVLEKVQGRIPHFPVVIHSLLTEMLSHPAVADAETFIEKNGDLTKLRQAVIDVFQK